MKDLVIYHNDFNKIKLPNFGSQEQNILMGIISKIRNAKTNEKIVFYPQELLEFSTDNFTSNELQNILTTLKAKFFKADFTILVKKDELFGVKTINLFSEFVLWYHDKEHTNFKSLELQVNPQFKYLVQELTGYFTKFELTEFMGLTSKYSKTLYRILKQFRNTGEVDIFKNDWQGFCDIMGIPKDYIQGKIDERILKPALKELSAEPNLFNQTQTIFKNLKYKKIKDPKGRGRGGKVIGIIFTFDKEPNRNEFKEELEAIQNLKQTIEPQQEKQHPLTGETINELTPYIGRHFRVRNTFLGGYDTCKIKELNKTPSGQIYGVAINQENNSTFELNFESLSHLKNALNLD